MVIITAGFGVLLAASEIPSVVLNNGIRMPSVLWGAGGPTQEKGPETVAAVTLAVGAGVGFPGIDNANHYHNQAAVAAAWGGMMRRQASVIGVAPAGADRQGGFAILPLAAGRTSACPPSSSDYSRR